MLESGGFVCLVGTSAEILRWESFASEGFHFLRMTGNRHLRKGLRLLKDDSYLMDDRHLLS